MRHGPRRREVRALWEYSQCAREPHVLLMKPIQHLGSTCVEKSRVQDANASVITLICPYVEALGWVGVGGRKDSSMSQPGPKVRQKSPSELGVAGNRDARTHALSPQAC